MTRKSIYLLVPQKGLKGFSSGIDPEKIKVVGGRTKAPVEAEKLERELNGGKTRNEMMAACTSADQVEPTSEAAWQVHWDTDRSWSEFKFYDKWPQRIHDEVEALLNQP